MPLPARIERGHGAPVAVGGRLNVELAGVGTPRLTRAIARLREAAPVPAQPLPPVRLVIDCLAAGAACPALGDDESYTLAVSAGSVRIEAPVEWGVLRALATLTQLRSGGDRVPVMRIVDRPRFAWRGLMLDVARHFIPHPDLLRTLDAMAVFKLNVLHLHLSDDQAFRFPSRRFPRLTSAEHYTLAELEDLVAQASDRGIRLIPELDVPGHTASWLFAYPQWGNRPAEPSRRFGVHHECLDPTRPAVVEAVEVLFTELAATFPDHYLHLGGDEVHPAWWSEDSGIRAFMERHGLADAAALQARFTERLATAIERQGRRALGWDEVLNPALPAGVTVQAWRGATARDRALAAGHDCVVSGLYYLDLLFPADVYYGFDPASSQPELLQREDAMIDDPRFAHVAAGMAWTRQWRADAAEGTRTPPGTVLGAEACLWAELVDARVLDVRLWSRMPALAERFWSPAECRDVEDMYRRLDAALEGLSVWAGVEVDADSRRLTAQAGVPPAWQPLVEMLEPVKWYGRLLGEVALAARISGSEMPKSRPYDADTPLDRVIDALPPESRAARRLAALTRAQRAGDSSAAADLRRLAETWKTLPVADGPAELEEAARRLRALGALVPAVLDGALGSEDARARLAEAARPMGEYLLAPALVLDAWLA